MGRSERRTETGTDPEDAVPDPHLPRQRGDSTPAPTPPRPKPPTKPRKPGKPNPTDRKPKRRKQPPGEPAPSPAPAGGHVDGVVEPDGESARVAAPAEQSADSPQARSRADAEAPAAAPAPAPAPAASADSGSSGKGRKRAPGKVTTSVASAEGSVHGAKAAAGKRGKTSRSGSSPVRTARDVLLDHLRGEVSAFMAEVPRVREHGEDSAHQMRVAARRMRSALRTCQPLLEPEAAQALAVDLRWAADCLAGERDNEVLLERLVGALEQLPVRSGTPRARSAVERRLRGGLAAGHTTALRALDSADFATLVDRLAEPELGLGFTAEADGPAAVVVPALAAKTFRRLARGAAGLPLAEAAVPYAHPVPLSGEDDEAWHRVRILGKRARYAADMCVPEFGAPAKSLAKRMKEVTESLGTHQDAALAAEVARELALSPRIGGAAAFVLGELFTVQRFAVAEARLTFATVWPTLRDRLDEVERWGD
ncbi:CHAD domain-containing protein [Yinghuangia seranimata]|uniref:CHAD domain-containing protein n=1 Tax=Yinghuangia seranimata TaxID=408067 RepID=UPI00248BA1AF|nr:CHAD domain-containing protein [Yinghuangia seranimata]MDI2131736.1 CHAD domain-containing protein [Yinghuangia seranimata]